MSTPDDEQLEAMLAPLASWNRCVLREVESRGYRVGIACDKDTWYATAKRDEDGDFHSVKAESEDEVVVWLAWSVGLDAMD